SNEVGDGVTTGHSPLEPVHVLPLQFWGGGGAPHFVPVTVVPVTVTATFERARPSKVPRVSVTEVPARLVPRKCESVIVAASPAPPPNEPYADTKLVPAPAAGASPE